MNNEFSDFDEIQNQNKKHKNQIFKSFSDLSSLKKDEAIEKGMSGGGIGSRGGKVIGYTKNGKPIYESDAGFTRSGKEIKHENHGGGNYYNDENRKKIEENTTFKDWSHEDHADAAKYHEKKMKAADKSGDKEEGLKHYHDVVFHKTAEGYKKERDGVNTLSSSEQKQQKEYNSLSKEQQDKYDSHMEKYDIAGGTQKKDVARMHEAALKHAKNSSDDIKKGMGGGKIIGHTSSGKSIYDSLSAKEHKGFTPEDHRDAADLFHAHVLKGGIMHRKMKAKRDEHHILAEKGGNSLKDRENKNIEDNKIKKSFDDDTILGQDLMRKGDELEKANGEGEGSRGGKIIGHTKSGKPIYEPQSNKSSIGQNKFHNALGYTKQDHNDAAKLHRSMKETATEDDIPRHNLQAQYHDQAKGIDIKKSFDDLNIYEQDDLNIIRKGEILDRLGMNYNSSGSTFTFTKTGKELKVMLPITIAALSAKKDALETVMEALKVTAGCEPTEVYQSYQIKSIACKRYPYKLYDCYDKGNNCYVDPTDAQKAMQQYNDACYAWQSLSEDIIACKVINKNLDDNKEYTLTVNQLVALASGDDDLSKAVKDNLEKGVDGEGSGKVIGYTKSGKPILKKSIAIYDYGVEKGKRIF